MMNNNDKKILEISIQYSQQFDLDLEYYLDFCLGYKTLDLFAGCGRLTNFLARHMIDIESVEIEKGLAKLIRLPQEKIHVCDVLEFKPKNKFERVIAGYNSFGLLTEEKDISRFFLNLDAWLISGGFASLSYYHPDYWHIGINEIIQLEYDNQRIEYMTSFDLSKRHEHIGIWIDQYLLEGKVHKFTYPLRVYDFAESIQPFLEKTKLKMIDVVKNYNKDNIEYPGWIDFVLEKQ